ncbi:MAG: hypothetical protein FP826_02470 [Sphingomonadales bacterium]|nr:hypothetical protein [Sphingomonadales bacterium]MBU3991269.1 hypothetical protein [Alphaproteobacteria bacterium]
MTMTQPAKPAAATVAAPRNAQAKPASNPKPAEDKPEAVTLDQLAREMKLSPRDARMLLRLAAKQTKLYPTLGKEHVARQPWSWAPGSKALEEARKALETAQTDA